MPRGCGRSPRYRVEAPERVVHRPPPMRARKNCEHVTSLTCTSGVRGSCPGCPLLSAGRGCDHRPRPRPAWSCRWFGEIASCAWSGSPRFSDTRDTVRSGRAQSHPLLLANEIRFRFSGLGARGVVVGAHLAEVGCRPTTLVSRVARDRSRQRRRLSLTPRVSLFAIALVFGFAACVIVGVLVLRPVERIARTARVSSRACRAARSGDGSSRPAITTSSSAVRTNSKRESPPKRAGPAPMQPR